MRIIAGRWKGHSIRAPAGDRVRPTADRVREAWMSMLGQGLVGMRVVDLFAGSGALGLEALSRGAREVVLVERSGPVLRVLRRNVEALGPEEGEARIVREDALRYIEDLDPDAFDVALADPPYGKDLASRLLDAFHRSPFARELWVEHGADEELPPIPHLWSRAYGDTMLTRLEGDR